MTVVECVTTPELIGRPSMTESCRGVDRRARGRLSRLARLGDMNKPVAPESTRATEVMGADSESIVTSKVMWSSGSESEFAVEEDRTKGGNEEGVSTSGENTDSATGGNLAVEWNGAVRAVVQVCMRLSSGRTLRAEPPRFPPSLRQTSLVPHNSPFHGPPPRKRYKDSTGPGTPAPPTKVGQAGVFQRHEGGLDGWWPLLRPLARQTPVRHT